jgi:hypothetical protein
VVKCVSVGIQQDTIRCGRHHKGSNSLDDERDE